jgi:predicted nuclease of predicted toxin-antitoxin system
MCLKLLFDMNLSPNTVDYFISRGYETLHWQKVGAPDATDAEIMRYAREHGFVVLTYDLDFGTILSITQADSPSVVQIRAKEALSEKVLSLVLDALNRTKDDLLKGAILTIDVEHIRLRLLPIGS